MNTPAAELQGIQLQKNSPPPWGGRSKVGVMRRSFPPHPDPLPPGEREGHSSPQHSWGVFWHIFIKNGCALIFRISWKVSAGHSLSGGEGWALFGNRVKYHLVQEEEVTWNLCGHLAVECFLKPSDQWVSSVRLHTPLTIADVVKGGPPAVKRNPVQFKQLLDDMDVLNENFGFYSKSFNRWI